MDDLISRQKALDHLRKRLIQTANNNVGFVCDAGSTFQDASERVKTWLDELPSIDAVPVIRCKDCKWWDEKDDGPYGYCMAMKHGYFSSNWEIGIYRTYKGDWFCADGERENDETDYRKE